MLKTINLILICFIISNLGIAQSYYGVNNFGKIEFIDNNKLYFDYFDVGNDTAFYKIVKDTIFITSSHQSVDFQFTENINNNTSIDIDVNMKIYRKNGFILVNGVLTPQYGDLQTDTLVKMDTLNRIYVDNLFLYSGQLISFDIFGKHRYIVPKDTVLNGFFQLDVRIGKSVYLNNYPLLMRDNYLLPFDEKSNEYFRKINGFEFLPMKKGNKNQKYKVYLSGFGEIH